MKRLYYLFSALLLAALACNVSLPGGGAGSLNNPVPAGEAIETQWGTVRIVNYQRPTAFQVTNADLFTGITGDQPVQPATGAEFVSIELEFTCATTETVCDEPPEAVLDLVLEDGRVVEEGFVPFFAPWMGEEDVAGGATVRGWITFEVPEGAQVAALKITPFETEDEIHGALPAPVDGYTLDLPWVTYDDGSEEKELPALRRDMEEAGFEMLWAGLYRSEGETGLYVTVYTSELFFFDEAAAVEGARAALLQAVELWGEYGAGEAIYLGVEMANALSDEIVATVGAEVADIEAYLNGDLDVDGFMAVWWVVME